MTQKEFFEACERFDWYYAFSDDHRIYKAGVAAAEKLQEEADEDVAKRAIFDAWSQHFFSGEQWGTPKASKPLLVDFNLE